jgi:hypothetical protein
MQKSVVTEVAWRWAVAFVTATAGLGLLPVRVSWFAFWTLVAKAPVQPLMIVAAFWIVAGAVVRAAVFHRRLVLLLLLRTVSFAAGSAAVFASLQMVMAIARGGWPSQMSMAMASLFSLTVYCAWRWISLLVAVLEETGDWVVGWQAFVRMGSELALEAATNSTVKWFFLAITALPAVLLWRANLRWSAVTAMTVPIGTSGYFAARLKRNIQGLLKHELL